MSPSPQEDAAKIASEWREALQFVHVSLKRANYEYISKNELRGMALGALGTLEQMYTAALKRAEEVAAGPAESNIIVPNSDSLLPATPGGLITL